MSLFNDLVKGVNYVNSGARPYLRLQVEGCQHCALFF